MNTDRAILETTVDVLTTTPVPNTAHEDVKFYRPTVTASTEQMEVQVYT